MAHSQDTRDRVRQLFIEGMPLNGAAITCGVAYDTARDWKDKAKKNGDDWDTARAAFNISTAGVDSLNEQLIEHFARQALTTMREIENGTLSAPQKVELMAQLSDAYAKFSKAFSRVNPKLGALSVALDTLKSVAEYLSKHDKDALRGFQEHLEGIGSTLQARYG